MIAINAALLAAAQAGTGTPIFYITLYEYYSAAWHEINTFDVIKADLTRLKFTIEVHEDLVGSPNIVTTSGAPYGVIVTRGLSVAGTDYTIDTRLYFVSEANYLENDHKTVLVADLLPAIAIRSIAADTLAGTVIDNALTSVLVTDFFVDATRDIWYGWQFYPATKDLNLYDARSLSSLLASKYFAYLFPRATGLEAYNVPSNFENAEDGNYTPFAHAKARQITSSDKYMNLSWSSETGKKYMTRDATYAYHSLGFISDVDAPLGYDEFIEWGQVFTRHTYEIEQRPDFRLEHGDLIKLSYDAFDKIRCIELEEHFKRGKDARWVQIIKQLQWHPQASTVRIGDFPDDPTPKPSASNVSTNIDNFTQILSIADSTVQAALDTIDEHTHLGGVFTPPLVPNLGGTGVANGAAATLTLAAATTITGGGTIALGGFTLTVPATLTVAGLAIANVFTTQQKIDGTSDQVQLIVEAHSTQTNKIVVIQSSATTSLLTIDGSGHVHIGPTWAENTYYKLKATQIFTNINAVGGGMYSYGQLTQTSANNAKAFYAHRVYSLYGATSTYTHTGGLNGISGEAYNSSDQTVDSINGLVFTGGNLSTGTITTFRAIFVSNYSTGGYITNLYGVDILTGTGGTVTNQYGLKISDINRGGTLNYSILTNAGNIVFNNGGDANSDLTIKTDSYDAIFSDASNNSVMVMSNTAGKVGFYGVTAVAQQVLATGGGATADNIISFLQTVGLCKQS